MNFKSRRISREPSKVHKKISEFRSKKFARPGVGIHIFPVVGGIALICILLFGIFQLIRSMDFTGIIFSLGKPLQTDSNGRTNILLAGIGGEGHDGPNLTDTLIVASIDPKNHIVSMISIPRDLYVETKQTGRSRINTVLHLGIQQFGKTEGLTVLKDTISKIVGVPIHYYVKIDFAGFEKIVDSIGGVDVINEYNIYDPEYPKGETVQYETFTLAAGPQHLDGETALKYARSRHGSSGGNFGRAKRQQQLLYALKEKALNLNILTNPSKIQEIFNSVSESLETNLSLAEIIELSKFAKDANKESAVSFVINDDFTTCGGLVYAPAREFFDGAAVFLPAGNNFDYMHFFVDTVIKNSGAIRDAEHEKIQVLNGTKVAGIALEGMTLLSRFCLDISYFGNAENRDITESTIFYKTGPNGEKPKVLDMVNTLFPGIKNVPTLPAIYLDTEKRADSAVIIELGSDYLNKRLKDPFDSLKYLVAPASQTQAADTVSATEATTQESTP